MKYEKIYVNGMTCINCQSRIEKVLRENPAVTEVSVSYEKGTAEYRYDPKKTTQKQIMETIKSLGYEASTEVFSGKSKWFRAIGEIVIIAVLFLILQYTGLLNRMVPGSLADSEMGYRMLFVIGLITSVHCVAMCGGISLSQTLHDSNSGKMFRNTFMYNLGRLTSYTVIGGILGGVGSLAGIGNNLQSSPFLQGSIKLAAGIFMIIMGINMLGIFPGLRRVRLQLPFFKKTAGKGRTPFIVGLCNGLMPCGPLQAMQIAALASGSVSSGALSMLCFSLGTVPLMLGFGSVISALGKKFTRQILKSGAILVVVMGLAMMSQGMALAGLNSRSSNSSGSISADKNSWDNTDVAVEKEGIQYVSSTLESGHYPDITVRAGEPVEWKIEAAESNINGCNYKIIQQDFGIEHTFEKGENAICFTPEKEGVYTYSCWMGMITGKIYVEN